MTQFNKGDRVVRVGYNHGSAQQGKKVYTVNRQDFNTLYLEGCTLGYAADLFDLLKPAAIKPEGAYNPNVGHTTDGGGLQQHSIGGPYPYIVVAVDNPTGLEPGLYYYVQDKAGNRCTAHTKSAEKVIRVAATLAENRPEGTTGFPPPDLSRSEGYISPTITVELNREAAEFLTLLVAHTAGNVGLTNDLLAAFADKLGYTYDKAKEKFDVSFCGYGEQFDTGWHAGRHRRGAIAITPKGAL